MILRAMAAYYREEFKQLGRIDDNFRIRVGAEYHINRVVSVATRYTYRVRDSNAPGRDFRSNIIKLTFEIRL